MIYRIIKIANKIATDVINEIEAKEIESFDMTEREWEEYSKKHPNALRENHNIIPVPGKSHKNSDDFNEYMQREAKAKVEYFKEMKAKHPNYVPIISKEDFSDVISNGEFTCISAGPNTNDPEDVERCKNHEYLRNRHESLRKDLDKLGVKYTEIVGSYGGEEPSFMITHDLKGKVSQKKKDNSYLVSGNQYSNEDGIIEKLNNLGKKYNQDSVAHGKNGIMEWHYTTGENAGKRIVTGIEIQNSIDDDDFFSETRISNDCFTKWKATTENALDDNFDLRKENLINNPYFK